MQVRKQSILPPAELRNMRKGSAIMLASGARPASIELQMWFQGPRKAEITRANERAVAALTERASGPQPKAVAR